jgi:hypothetical protein
MQKLTREQDAIDLCKKLFDFVCSEYNCVQCEDERICSIKEQFNKIVNQKSDYGQSAEDLLSELDRQNKRLGSFYSTRIQSSVESSHGWKLSQEKEEGRSTFKTSKEAITSLIDDLKEL